MTEERQSFGTGDLNLAAACMSVGVPLDDSRGAVKVILSDNSREYCRFFLMPVTVDGRVTTERLMQAWTKRDRGLGGEAFGWLMDFLSEKPGGVVSLSDWFGWAHDWLRSQRELGHWPGSLDKVAEFVARHPDDKPGHVFAFLLNRDVCFHLAKRAMENPQIHMRHGARGHILMDAKAPKWRREQFLKMVR